MSEISLEERGGQAILSLRGAIDASCVPDLLSAALRANGAGKAVVLDWSAAEYLHTGALQVLLALKAELTAGGRTLLVSTCSSGVQECITAAGVVDTFEPEAIREDARCIRL